jgi:hypothetical protein
MFQYAVLIIERVCVCMCNRRHIKLITNWISSLWYSDDKDDDELRDEDIWDRDGDDNNNDNNETKGGPGAVASTLFYFIRSNKRTLIYIKKVNKQNKE